VTAPAPGPIPDPQDSPNCESPTDKLYGLLTDQSSIVLDRLIGSRTVYAAVQAGLAVAGDLALARGDTEAAEKLAAMADAMRTCLRVAAAWRRHIDGVAWQMQP
jgi:hypothetical protein